LTLVLFLILGAIALAQNRKVSDSSKAGNGPNSNKVTGQQAFAENCAGCHGLDGKGGERGPDIVTPQNVRGLSDSELLQILKNGIPRKSMPSFGHLGDPVLRSITSYLRTLQGNSVAATLSGNAKRGADLFFGKGDCSRCHMIHGEGGFFASDLSEYSRGRSPETIRGAIVTPNRDLDPRRRTVTVILAGGKKIEGIARNEDNFSIQLQSHDGTLYLLNKSELAGLSYRNESPMPADYATRLSSAELDDLVNYLFSISKNEAKQSGNREEPDEE
jgi:putative heme-binding domain-containing protein